MAKTAKTPAASNLRRSASSGQFIGRTSDGILIPKPDFKPQSFTVRQLQEAIRAVREKIAAQAG